MSKKPVKPAFLGLSKASPETLKTGGEAIVSIVDLDFGHIGDKQLESEATIGADRHPIQTAAPAVQFLDDIDRIQQCSFLTILTELLIVLLSRKS
jgi:hypothetical protein